MPLTQTGETWEGADSEGRNQNLHFEGAVVEVSMRSQVVNRLYESGDSHKFGSHQHTCSRRVCKALTGVSIT